MKRSHIINALVLAGRNERKLTHLSNDALRKLMNLSSKKITAIKEEKAKQEAELFVRMEVRKEQQKEAARIERLATDKALLRAKRESEEKAAIKRFEVRGFVPLPKIGEITPEMSERINVRTELTRHNNAVNRAKLVLRVEGWSKQAEEAAKDAVIQRQCFIHSLPEEAQRQIRAQEYVQTTERPLFGSASFQK
jgi:hypothetical protein